MLSVVYHRSASHGTILPVRSILISPSCTLSKTTAAMAEAGLEVRSSPGGSVGTWITSVLGVWAATGAATAAAHSAAITVAPTKRFIIRVSSP